MSSSMSKPFVATPLTPFTTPLCGARPALRSLPDLEGYLERKTFMNACSSKTRKNNKYNVLYVQHSRRRERYSNPLIS